MNWKMFNLLKSFNLKIPQILIQTPSFNPKKINYKIIMVLSNNFVTLQIKLRKTICLS